MCIILSALEYPHSFAIPSIHTFKTTSIKCPHDLKKEEKIFLYDTGMYSYQAMFLLTILIKFFELFLWLTCTI